MLDVMLNTSFLYVKPKKIFENMGGFTAVARIEKHIDTQDT